MEKEVRQAYTDMVESIMAQHGLIEQGWRFEFNNRKTAVGLCNLEKKRIYYSERYLDADPKSIMNTILHEIAHALCPPERVNGRWDIHGPKWRKTAIAIGCTGTRCAEGIERKDPPKVNYTIGCDSCGTRYERNRITPKLRRKICGHCRGPLTIRKVA